MPDTHYQLSLNVRDYMAMMFATGLMLILIHVGLYLYNYLNDELPWLLLQLFDLDEENNIPTWFSSFLLLNNAFFLFLISTKETLEKKGHWRFLAYAFLLLAVDEVAGLHESFNSSVEVNWAIPGAIVTMLIGVAYVPFLLSLQRSLALKFMLAGFLYVSGVILVELLSEDMDSDTLAYCLAVAVEEGLEMLGAWYLLFVLLSELKRDKNTNIKIALA